MDGVSGPGASLLIVFRPLSTDSEGRFLSYLVPAPNLDRPRPRSRRHAPDGGREDHMKEKREEDRGGGGAVFYNVTIFGRELHLRLQQNRRLVAPGATIDWQEEDGGSIRLPLVDAQCHYSGGVTNTPDAAVALSTCHGLAGMIRLGKEEYFIEPLERGEKAERGKGRGQEHIVYRMSDIIKHPTAVNHTADDFKKGDTSHYLVLLGVDYSVMLFHGREQIQRYLLTLMNIVNEIYQDRSLGANINIILVRIIILSASKSQELIEVWNPSQSLVNVCRWAYLQQRAEQSSDHHDHAIYITRQEFGPAGMQGYAPVTGMCQPVRSCTLTLEDGFSSAFVVAHETGHVLGMEHDSQENGCSEEALQGSIMSPLVQAAFHRYHWSRCSRQELSTYLPAYDCLRDDPFHYDRMVEPQLPGLQFSMDQQCRFDFGSDYTLCTAYSTYDPCKQLWCSHPENPFFCKTKKSPPVDGTKCGPGRNCFKGYCLNLTPDLLRQDGGWASWSLFGSCSRSCGGGVQYRTRHCTGPAPANGGRPCIGNRFEFQLCSLGDCPTLSDYRAEQCQLWDPHFEHEGTKHHWLTEDRCQLYCQSKETGEVVYLETQVHDGTRCSYSDDYSLCVRGECEHVGCDHQVASDMQEDRCGVCGGNNSTCQVVKGNFTRSAKEGYLKILEIPEGARHLVVTEHRTSPHILALKNQETGLLFLNGDGQLPESRGVIERGVAWTYTNQEDRDTVATSGPLTNCVIIMAKVTVSYKYVIKETNKSCPPSAVDNRLPDDTGLYQWALKKWSECSQPCGAGKQYTRFGCRRKADGKMVQRVLCSNVSKPRAISRWCNTQACPTASWVLAHWSACSASCGQSGYETRSVRCQQASTGGQQRSVSSRLCTEERPAGRRPCGRVPCPLSWRTGPWSPCSVTCGNGTIQRQVLCGSDQNSSACGGPTPVSLQPCQLPSCTPQRHTHRDTHIYIFIWQRCRGDQSAFCRLQVLSRYCSMPKYRQMCCKSCSHGNFTSHGNVSSLPTTSAVGTTTQEQSILTTPAVTTPTRAASARAPPPSFSNAVDEALAPRERGGRVKTQNRRIQQLLNEKRRREVLRRASPARNARKHTH
uniref:A disintegrin and metalloproteinase with thrombospondin motifs 2-like n=1 Tax=Gadus morhua TaxID=8049 RepID=A0A8C5FCX4_GADMO